MKIYETVEDVQMANDNEMKMVMKRYLNKLRETDEEILDLTELGLGIYKLIDKQLIKGEAPEDEEDEEIIDEYESQRYEVYLYAPENGKSGQLEICMESFQDKEDNDFYEVPSVTLEWFHPVCLKLLSLGAIIINQPDGSTGYVNRYTGIFRQFKNIESFDEDLTSGYRLVNGYEVDNPFSSVYWNGTYEEIK